MRKNLSVGIQFINIDSENGSYASSEKGNVDPNASGDCHFAFY